MTIEKKPGRPILSLIHPCLVRNSLIEVKKASEITIEALDLVAEMAKPLPLVSTLSKSKNKVNKPKNDSSLAGSSAITIK